MRTGVLADVGVRKVVSDGVVLAVVLQFLGRHRRAEEILQVLQDVLLGRSKGPRLRMRVKLALLGSHGDGLEDALLAW